MRNSSSPATGAKMRALGAWMGILALAGESSGAPWSALAMPEIGEITALGSDAASLYAGTVTGYVYRSTDGGATWTALLPNHPGFTTPLRSPIRAIHSVGPTLMVGAGRVHNLPYNAPVNSCGFLMEPCVYEPTQEGGLYYSTNGGANWHQAMVAVPADPPPRLFNITALIRAGEGLVAGSARGLYRAARSAQGGDWTPYGRQDGLPSNSPRFGRNSIIALEAADSTLFALTDSALYIGPLEPGAQGGAGFAEHPLKARALARIGSCVVVAAADGIRRTRNAGDAWETLGGGRFAVLQAHGALLYGVKDGMLHRSADTGKTWARALAGAPGPLAAFHVRKGRVHAGLSGLDGAFLGDLDGTLQPYGRGFRDNPATALLYRDGALWAGSSYGGLWRRDPSGAWSRRIPGSVMAGSLAADPGSREGVLAAGLGLQSVGPSGAARAVDTAFTDSYIPDLATGDGFTVVSTGKGLHRCLDGQDGCRPLDLRSLPADAGSPRGLAAHGDNIALAARSLHVSTDRGATWKTMGALDSGFLRVEFLGGALVVAAWTYVDPGVDRIQVKMSDDLGATWSSLPTLMGRGVPMAVAGHAGDVHLATAQGVFHPGTSGSWVEAGSGLPAGGITALAWEGRTLAAAHADGRIFTLPLQGTGIRTAGSGSLRRPAGRILPGAFHDAAGRVRTVDGRAARIPVSR